MSVPILPRVDISPSFASPPSHAQYIAQLRRQLFELESEIVLSRDGWEAIWPYIDNMWVERNSSRNKERRQYNCRIWRDDSGSSKKIADGGGTAQRNRPKRVAERCSMKMYVEYKDNAVRITRCPGRVLDVTAHNHDMAYLDKIKTPSAIMRLAADIVGSGKGPAQAIKELRQLPIVRAMEASGGLYIDNNRVRNAHKASLTPSKRARGKSNGEQQQHIDSLMADAGTDDELGSAPGLQVACQCGAVTFSTPTRKPLGLYHCHCAECRKQSASAYGTSAIFPASTVFPLPERLTLHLSLYQRPSKTGGTVDCYFCRTCGSRLLHRVVDGNGIGAENISIKGGVIDGLDWSGGEHIWTSRAVVPIPAGARSWRESPEPETDSTNDGSPSMQVPSENGNSLMELASGAVNAQTEMPIATERHEISDEAIHPDLVEQSSFMF